MVQLVMMYLGTFRVASGRYGSTVLRSCRWKTNITTGLLLVLQVDTLALMLQDLMMMMIFHLITSRRLGAWTARVNQLLEKGYLHRANDLIVPIAATTAAVVGWLQVTIALQGPTCGGLLRVRLLLGGLHYYWQPLHLMLD